MSDPANQLNVPTDAPIGVYRAPNRNPSPDTDNKDVSFGQSGTPVSNTEVSTGAVGAPVSNGG